MLGPGQHEGTGLGRIYKKRTSPPPILRAPSSQDHAKGWPQYCAVGRTKRLGAWARSLEGCGSWRSDTVPG